jgi:effector-binding domain-containing protein
MPDINTGECSVVRVEQRPTAVIKTNVPFAQIPDAHRSMRPKVLDAAKSQNVPLGATCTRWRPPADGKLYMEIGVLVSGAFQPVGDVIGSELPAGRAAHLFMAGPYDGLPGAWQTLFDWCGKERLTPAGVNWEIYSDDPSKPHYALYALLA